MNSTKETLSCIIITFNQSKYLFEAIDSVLAQDYIDYELIIADDCSYDFDKEKIETYIENKKKSSLCNYIVYSNEVNKGTVKNINEAIRKASGKYIKVFGGDDAIANEKVFSFQIEYLIKHPNIVAVTGKSIQCDEMLNEIYDINVVNNNRLIPKVIAATSSDEKRRIISKNYIFPFMTQSICFKSDFFSRYGLYDERYQLLEDTPMMNRIIDDNIPVGFIDKYVIKHRTKVGISSADILYNPKSIRYYEDCKLMAFDSLQKEARYSEKIKAWQRYKIASLRMELCKKSTAGDKIRVYLYYLPNIIFYLIRNPKKAKAKLLHKLK